MNPFSVPSLISSILLSALGVILYLQNPKQRIDKVFSALMFVSALSNVSAFLFHLSTTAAAAQQWTKIPYVFAIPSQIFGMYYVLILTGRDQRMWEKILGLPVAFHFRIVVLLNIVLLGLLIFTDSIIAGVEHNPITGYEHTYGKLFVLAMIYFTYVGTVELALTIVGYRHSSYWLEKVWLKHNIIGLMIIFFFGGVLALYRTCTDGRRDFSKGAETGVKLAVCLVAYHGKVIRS